MRRRIVCIGIGMRRAHCIHRNMDAPAHCIHRNRDAPKDQFEPSRGEIHTSVSSEHGRGVAGHTSFQKVKRSTNSSSWIHSQLLCQILCNLRTLNRTLLNLKKPNLNALHGKHIMISMLHKLPGDHNDWTDQCITMPHTKSSCMSGNCYCDFLSCQITRD